MAVVEIGVNSNDAISASANANSQLLDGIVKVSKTYSLSRRPYFFPAKHGGQRSCKIRAASFSGSGAVGLAGDVEFVGPLAAVASPTDGDAVDAGEGVGGALGWGAAVVPDAGGGGEGVGGASNVVAGAAGEGVGGASNAVAGAGAAGGVETGALVVTAVAYGLGNLEATAASARRSTSNRRQSNHLRA